MSMILEPETPEEVTARKLRHADLEAMVEQLDEEVNGLQFDVTGHAEPWRNELAEQLNTVLGCAGWRLGCWGDASDIHYARAALAIVRRVAEAEGIRKV
jgi:hypothetical protein